MTYFDLSKLTLASANVLNAFESNCNGERRVKVAEDYLHQKCQIPYYQNKNWLSVFRLLSLQLKPELGRMRPAG